MVLKLIQSLSAITLALLLTGCSGSSNSPQAQGPENPLFSIQNNALSASEGHALIVKDGNLYGVGNNDHGQLGKITKSWKPLSITTPKNTLINQGIGFIIKQDSSLWATGINTLGQAGNGTRTNIKDWTQVLTNVTAIKSAFTHSLALKADNSVWATGWNQFSFGNSQNRVISSWQQVFTNAKSIHVDNFKNLIIDQNDTLWVAGNNTNNSLHTTTNALIKEWTQVTTNVKAVSSAAGHTLIAKADNTVWAIGENTFKNFHPTIASTNTWIKVYDAPSSIKQVYTYQQVSAILLENGSLLIKGWDQQLDWQQIANNIATAYPDISQPRILARTTDGNSTNLFALDLLHERAGTLIKLRSDTTNASASGENIIVITTSQQAYGAGPNANFQLGELGDTTWAQIDVSTPFKFVTTTTDHSFAIDIQNTLWATGENTSFGLKDRVNRQTWTQVFTNVATISTSRTHSLAIRNDQTLWGSGSNTTSQMALSQEQPTVTEWKQLRTNILSAAAGDGYSLVVTTTGNLQVSGQNSVGQLGTGSAQLSTWTSVLDNVKKVVTSRAGSSFALKTDGTLWATGSNFEGQLGNGAFSDLSTWTQVLTGVENIHVGLQHALALKTDGTLWGTGNNDFGQLGLGNAQSPSSWTFIINEVKAAGAGDFQSIIVKEDDTLWVTGDNEDGVLGLPQKAIFFNWQQILENL